MPESFEQKRGLRETYEGLPGELRALIPETDYQYLERTNAMHCRNASAGGSKFASPENGGVSNILEVLMKDKDRIIARIQTRDDEADREALKAAGAPESAFLPATKDASHPADLPEALYFRVEAIKGRLGIIKLGELPPETPVIINREKSSKDENGKEKVPCSFTAIAGQAEDLPETDFATVIIGREGGQDALWTIHPGAPIRPSQNDSFPGSESLPGPTEGTKPRAIVTTVEKLLTTGKITKEDFIKIIPGNPDEVIAEYEVVS